jgi:hypothetical protein
MIIYMTTIIYENGRKEVRFSGRKNQYGGLSAAAHMRYKHIARVQLHELGLSASDFTLIDEKVSGLD